MDDEDEIKARIDRWSDRFPANKEGDEEITVLEALTRQDKKIAEIMVMYDGITIKLDELKYYLTMLEDEVRGD